MGEETVLTWTVPNWITVLLMVILGFAVIGCAAKMIGSLGTKAAPDAA
jgi:hypothetical protein